MQRMKPLRVPSVLFAVSGALCAALALLGMGFLWFPGALLLTLGCVAESKPDEKGRTRATRALAGLALLASVSTASRVGAFAMAGRWATFGGLRSQRLLWQTLLVTTALVLVLHTLTPLLARTSLRTLWRLARALLVGSLLGSVLSVARWPLPRVPEGEVVVVPPFTRSAAVENEGSGPTQTAHAIPGGAWLHRWCHQQHCFVELTAQRAHTVDPEPLFSESLGVRAVAPLRVRWLPRVGSWLVQELDGASAGPPSVFHRGFQLPQSGAGERFYQGPSRALWLLTAWALLFVYAAWSGAREGRSVGQRAVEAVHRGEGRLEGPWAVDPTVPRSVRAALLGMPEGPVVLECIDEPKAPFRASALVRVREAYEGTLAQWERERALSPLLPWVLAAVTAYCALGALAASGR